ncbi:MAG TPA: murein biosynthesis integral membrane protein MurJ [Xanthobacteraceae bacterium]|nr:murein biosynthesis integral membrane protein MurJ [Xanthobacteraceae bacterium]
MSQARDVVTVGGATLLSRLLAFGRDVAIAAVLGAGALADAFFIALQIPNLFRRLLAEGALNSAFVPLWLRRQQEDGARGARRFSEDVLGTLAATLAATAVLCAVFASVIVSLLAPGFEPESYLYAVYFLRLASPYLAIVGMVAVMAATLNAAGQVGAAAYGPVIFNVVMITAAAGVAVSSLGDSPVVGAILAGAVVVAGLFQLLVVGGAMFRLPDAPVSPQLSLSPDVRRFFRMMLPGVIAAGIPQLTLIAGTIVASSSPSAVSWLTYSFRLYELPLGVVSVAIASVMTPAIAAHVRADDHTASASAQSRAFEIAFGLALPAAVGLALLAEPIVTGLFQRGAFSANDTAAVAGALAAIALGIPGHALEKVLASVSFAHEDTRTPMLTALAGLAVSAVAAVLMFRTHGHVGIALAIAACGWVSAALLGIALLRRHRLQIDAHFMRRMGAIVLATALMGAAIFGMHRWLTMFADGNTSSIRSLTIMTILVMCGVAVYAGVLRLFGVLVINETFSKDRSGQ